MRRGNEGDDAQRMFIDNMGPDDHRDQLEQRSDDLRGQIEQGMSQQHLSGSQPAEQTCRGTTARTASKARMLLTAVTA